MRIQSLLLLLHLLPVGVVLTVHISEGALCATKTAMVPHIR